MKFNFTPPLRWQITVVLILAFGINSLSALAQQNTVKGVVKDAAGNPIIGASVVEKGTTNGMNTDENGNYFLQLRSKNPVLEFSFVGYTSRSVTVGAQTVIDVTLEEDKAQLEEVVVIGYGTAKKKDLTGAISTVNTEKLTSEAPRSVSDLLRSAAAGLNVSMSTDAEAAGSYSIRGTTTLSAGSSPLIVLDGVIYNGAITDINPYDVESVDVLKDASSAAIYGAKSSNGVICINTKKGRGGRPTISFNANIGFVHRARPVNVLDGEGFVKFRQDYEEGQLTSEERDRVPEKFTDPRKLQNVDLLTWYNYDQATPVTTLPDEETLLRTWLSRLEFKTIEQDNYLAGIETNWDDIVYQTGLQQDYTASISNNNEHTSYYWSVGYADREGVIVGNRYTNLRTRLNLKSKVTDWMTVGMNAQFAERKGGYLQADHGQRENNSPYTVFTMDQDSPYFRYPSGDNNTLNPFYENTFIDRRQLTQTLNASIYAIINLPFGIEYQMNYTPYFNWYEYYNHNSSESPSYEALGGSATRQHQKTYKWQLDNVIRWQREFGKHNINITLLQNAEKNQYWSDSMSATNFTPMDILGWHRMQAGTEQTISSDDTYDTGDALMARLFYSYDDTYMITASIRRDGYSAFGQGNPRASFPSVAVGWVFTNEKFLEKASKWLNYGKLRISWGENGNRDIGRYAALSTLTSSLHPYIDSTTGTVFTTSQIWVDKLANTNLSWETTESWNFGLDFGLFNNVLRGSAEFYVAKTKDLLVSRSIPSITGFSSIYDNLGQLNNHGFELTLNATPVQNKVVTWDSSVTFSLNRRKIVHLYGTYEDVYDKETGEVIGRKECDDVNNGWYIGHDTNQIYGYKRIGVWQLDEEEEAAVYGLKPGDFKYLDVDNNGVLNTDDKVWQGYTTPRYRLSWRNEFNFNNGISLSFMLYGNFGQWGTLNRAANAVSQPDRHTTIEIDRWTVDNPTNDFARIGSTNKGNNYVRKDFVRMESIALSYRLPKKWISKLWMDSATISLTVRNAFVMTGWYLGDPEQGDLTPRTWNINLNFTM